MPTRRKFLVNSIIGSAAILTSCEAAASATSKVNKPIVLSTWDFGFPANEEAWKILNNRGRALDAVEAGVKIPEGDPNVQTVGYGGFPDRDGHVTLDACIMDDKYNCGSVMFLENIKHPISVARLIMEKTPHIVLAGEGALEFAMANGFKKENLLTPKSEKTWKEWLKTSNYKPLMNIENRAYNTDTLSGSRKNHDTIGMIALDADGNLSGACTTSGLAFKMHGRVGDSPIIGAGLYVDNEIGAATSTGVGEEVIRIAGSFLVVELMRNGMSPEKACYEAVQRIIKRKPDRAKDIQVAFLALNKNGESGAYALQKGFTYAYTDSKENRMKDAKSVY